MSDDYKERIKKKISNYYQKNDPASAGLESKPKRKNEKPEKETEKEVMAWLKKEKFSAHVVESKSVWSEEAGRYLHGQTISGLSDVVGNDRFGRACFIELKASGNRSRLRDSQRVFLIEKINSNCFAIVTDSVGWLEVLYKTWDSLPTPEARREYLLSKLPQKGSSSVASNDGEDFFD